MRSSCRTLARATGPVRASREDLPLVVLKINPVEVFPEYRTHGKTCAEAASEITMYAQ